MIRHPPSKPITLPQNLSANITRKPQVSTKEGKNTFAVAGIVAAIVCVLAVIFVGAAYTAAKLKHEFKNIPEDKSSAVVSAIDSKQELEETLEKAEESTKKAENEPTDEYIESAKSDIKNLPYTKRTLFSERIAKLEKAKQEEKERAEKAKKDAEEQKKRAEQAATAAAAAKKTRQRQIQQQRQRQAVAPPAVTPAQSQALGAFFRNCKEARATGYSNMSRGTPGYREELDRDHDGTACER